MPVDQKSPAYSSNISAWSRARAVVSGEDAVKAAGETYLPKPSGQSPAEYEAYKTRASFFNGTGRTAEGLTGLAFRKDPAVAVPAAMADWLEDIDLAGTTIQDFVKRCFMDELQTRHDGILAEYPKAEVRERTAEEIAAEGLRPYLTYWPAESIWDWRMGRVGNRTTLVFLKLHAETFEDDPADIWAQIKVEWLRVYRLTAAGVQCEVWAKAEKRADGKPDEWTQQGEPFSIIAGGQVMREIPFMFASSSAVEKAPLTDLVLTNLSHYRTSADYENGLHWTGCPTPLFLGTVVDETGQRAASVKMGSSSGICMEQGDDAKFLEFQGQGLEGGLGAALTRKEQYMALLGARILASDQKGVEAAETAAIHRAGETSVLATLAGAVSRAVSKALSFMAQFAGITGEISFALCSDYIPTPMDAQTLTALVAAWQAGALSEAELFEALIAGEVIRSDKDQADHEAEVEAEQAKRDEKAADALANTAAALAAKKGGEAAA